MLLSNKKPQTPAPRPQNKFRALVFDLVTSRWFEIFMMGIICISVVAAMVETNDNSMEKEVILHWIYFILIIIFLIEGILKIIGLGRGYFRDGWNILDFVLIILSILVMFLLDLMLTYFIPLPLLFVIRSVRVFRILPLVPGTEGIQSLLSAIGMSLPALFNIGLLLFVIMFTFSVFGMSAFAYVKKAYNIDDMLNFETFASSMTCMFIITTGADWDGVILPFVATPPDCDPDIHHQGFSAIGECPNRTVAIIFFSSYLVISSLLVVSMYVTLILEIFDINTKDSGEPLSEDDLQMFYNTWMKFDPDATRCIQVSKLPEFCDSLKFPLRISNPNDINLMELPLLPGDKVHYLDILLAIRAQVFGDSGQVEALKANMEEKFKAKNPSEILDEPISSTLPEKQEEAAVVVQ